MWHQHQPEPYGKLNRQLKDIIHTLASLWLLQLSFSPFQSLFEDILEIFQTISKLLGVEIADKFTFRHMTGTLYQSRWVLLTWHFFKHHRNFSLILSSMNMAESFLNYRMINLCFPSPVTNLLTSVMQCWAQRKMVSSSNSHHIQRLSLNSESTTESSLRSDVLSSCLLYSMCVCSFIVM